MANEEELPRELEKLAISPSSLKTKVWNVNATKAIGTFSYADIDESYGAANRIYQTIYPNSRPYSCRKCSLRRYSESTLDELRTIKVNTNNLPELSYSSRNITGGTLKQALKKTVHTALHGKTNRRIILHEPILKALQTCLNPHSRFHRRLVSDYKSVGLNRDFYFRGDPEFKTFCNFRDLIVDCHGLLEENVDFSDRLNQLHLNNGNIKKLFTIEASVQKNKLMHKKAPIPLSIGNIHVLSNDENEADKSQTVSSSNIQQHHSSNVERLDSARSITSCSQQATSGSTNVGDDITINELASYFDTFVHIPKKMSPMAEMMYI